MSSCSSIILKNNGNVTFVSNPSITYFKSVYRKHTKFSIDYKEEDAEGDGNFKGADDAGGAQINIPLGCAADLLCDISLRVRFRGGGDGYVFAPPDDIALHLIKSITCNIIPRPIIFDKLDKEYINFNAMLNNPKPLESTYTLDDGKLTCNNGNNFQNMALCGGVTARHDFTDPIKIMDAIIPLPFGFSKSTGTAIPLCAFNQKTTQLKLLISRDPNQDFGKLGEAENIIKAFKYSAVSKYIFLSDEEIKRFKTTRLYYLYERVNKDGPFPTATGTPIHINTLTKHPIKQIFISVPDGQDRVSNTLTYNVSVGNASMFSDKFHHEFFSKVEILNKFKGCIYSKYDNKRHTIDDKVGIIDFSLKNTEGPSGCISPSNNSILLEIDNANIELNVNIYTVCYYLLRISDMEIRYEFD